MVVQGQTQLKPGLQLRAADGAGAVRCWWVGVGLGTGSQSKGMDGRSTTLCDFLLRLVERQNSGLDCWCGLVWSGLDWSGLDCWSGLLVWFELDWTGLLSTGLD